MLTRQERIIVFFLIGASIVGLGVLYQRNIASSPVRPQVLREERDFREGPGTICVDVSGAVWRPGVYELEKGARVSDVLAKAMLRPDADVDAVNRAALLSDGQKVVIPVKPTSSRKGEHTAILGKININTASEGELRKLPHVGKVRARDIVRYRDAHGPFADAGELKNVPGIGEETFEQLKDLVVVE